MVITYGRRVWLSLFPVIPCCGFTSWHIICCWCAHSSPEMPYIHMPPARLHYVSWTICYNTFLCIRYSGIRLDLHVYSDLDWGSDKDIRRSTSGVLIKMAGGPVNWMSKLQPIVTVSSIEGWVPRVFLRHPGRRVDPTTPQGYRPGALSSYKGIY